MAWKEQSKAEKSYIRVVMHIVVQSDSRELLGKLRRALADAASLIEITAEGHPIVLSDSKCLSTQNSSDATKELAFED